MEWVEGTIDDGLVGLQVHAPGLHCGGGTGGQEEKAHSNGELPHL